MPAVADPFGGSYFVERLTRELEEGALDYFSQIDAHGGWCRDRGRLSAAGDRQQRVSVPASHRIGDEVVVGVNRHADDAPASVETLYIDERTAERQVGRLAEVRARRDGARVQRSLDALRQAALSTDNLMPPLLDAVRAYATLGEMCDALRDVWGEYEETPSL